MPTPRTKSQNKTQATAVDPRQVIAKVEDDGKRADCLTLLDLMAQLADAPATMWGPQMIGFGRYHYVYDSGREGDFFLCGFAPRKNDLAIYLVGGDPDRADKLARLGRHKMAKSCLYVKRLSDIDMDVLQDLLSASIADLRARYP